MTGWKSKYGAILVGIGTALGASAAVAPAAAMGPWLILVRETMW